jgi:hypothetical protein
VFYAFPGKVSTMSRTFKFFFGVKLYAHGSGIFLWFLPNGRLIHFDVYVWSTECVLGLVVTVDNQHKDAIPVLRKLKYGEENHLVCGKI